MTPSLMEFLIKWRQLLQQNRKDNPIIYIEHGAWPEFNLALAETLEPSLGTFITEDAIRNRKAETVLMGFKFRQAPYVPPEEPALKRDPDHRFSSSGPVPPLKNKWDGRY